MFRTAIVILNWNGLGYLKMFLNTVVRNSQSPYIDIYVADNGSTDGSAEWIEANCSEVKLIKLNGNNGFAGGYNLALEKIEARYYVLLNSDIEVTEGWIQPLVDIMEINSDVASCQPKILSYYNRDYFEHAGAAGGFIDKYGFPFCRGRIFNYFEKDSGQYDFPADLFWSSGACMIVRADAWKKCGGFDASFFAHMEEIDLCWRFNKSGYRVCFTPLSHVYHVGGGALPYNSPFKTYLNFRNSLFLLYKNLPDKSLHKILLIRRLIDGLAAMMFLFNGSLSSVRSVWRAHMDYYKSLNVLRKNRINVKKLDSGNFTQHILNKSIVFEFYAKGNKTFSSLKTEI
jgi:GT2 family glycosyltransferase